MIRETCRDVRAAALVGGPGRTPQGTAISAFVYGPDGEPLTRYRVWACVPPFRAVVKVHAGGPPRPECALDRTVLLFDVLPHDRQRRTAD